jgi:tetratricopeptide (TPR) repeat protein
MTAMQFHEIRRENPMKRTAINGSFIMIFFLFLTLTDLGGNPEEILNPAITQEPEAKTFTNPNLILEDPIESENQVNASTGSSDEDISDPNSEERKGHEDLETSDINPVSYSEPETDLVDQVAKDRALSLIKIAQDLCDEKFYRESLSWAEDARQLDPGLPEAQFLSGYLHFRLRNTEEAIAAFEKTLELDPNNYEANLYLGIIYNGNENPSLALEYLTEAIQLADCPYDISTAFAHRALAYALLKRFDECFDDFDDALILDPNNGWAILFRGVVQKELAELEQSVSEVEGIPGKGLGFTK